MSCMLERIWGMHRLSQNNEKTQAGMPGQNTYCQSPGQRCLSLWCCTGPICLLIFCKESIRAIHNLRLVV